MLASAGGVRVFVLSRFNTNSSHAMHIDGVRRRYGGDDVAGDSEDGSQM